MIPTVTETTTDSAAASAEGAVGQPIMAPAVNETRQSGRDADTSADQAEGYGLDEKLAENIVGIGTHRHPQSDFPGALGHRHQHDIHDADAPHQQRNSRHPHAQHGEQADGFLEGVGNLGVVVDMEVSIVGRDVMPLVEKVVDFPRCFGHRLGRGGLHHDGLDALGAEPLGGSRQPLGQGNAGERTGVIVHLGDRPAPAVDTELDGSPRGDHDVVFILAKEVGALLAEHADDHKGDVLYADFCADGVGVTAAEQFADDGLPEQADLAAAHHLPVVKDPPVLQVGPVTGL